MYNVGFNRFGATPPVVKNLIYINVILFLAKWVLGSRFGINLIEILGLHYPTSELFKPVQIVTHMFMHADFFHIFFNMFALWMFGKILESVWGSQRFFIYFIITGLGAALIHTFVNYLQYSHIQSIIVAFHNAPSPDLFQDILFKNFNIEASSEFLDAWRADPGSINYIGEANNALNTLYTKLIDVPTVGASGAVYGVLLAFGMLFPNTELMFIFPPVPIKAKYVVMGYGAIELYTGLTQPGSNIAHFAHLGGMIFGFILIKFWNKKRTNFY
jgi:membrane associated rhomboid family serine protease